VPKKDTDNSMGEAARANRPFVALWPGRWERAGFQAERHRGLRFKRASGLAGEPRGASSLPRTRRSLQGGSGTRAGAVQAEFAQSCGKPMRTDGRAKLQPQNNSRERVIRVVGGCGSKASGGRQRMESGQGEEERSARPQGMSATVIWQRQSNTAAAAVKFQCGCDSAFAIGLLGSVVRPGGEACPVGSARGAGFAPIGLRHAFANHAAAETCVSAAACGGAPMRSVRHKGRKVRPALSVTELSFGEGLKAGCRPSAAREPARS
jgi:hypothetical protein